MQMPLPKSSSSKTGSRGGEQLQKGGRQYFKSSGKINTLPDKN